MPIKFTQKEFIEKSKIIHNNYYNYNNTNYVNSKTPCLITCPTHGNFLQKPAKHLMGRGCSKCKGGCPLSKEEFIFKATLLYGNQFDYNQTHYINLKIPIVIICSKHKISFTQAPTQHLNNKKKICYECVKEQKLLLLKNFIYKSNLIHNYKFTYLKSVYTDVKTKLIITCPIHGDFSQKPSAHLEGSGCYKCGKNSLKLTQSEFINKCNLVHNNFYLYNKTIYKDSRSKIIITCPIHGDFVQLANNHIRGKKCINCCIDLSKDTTNDFIRKAKTIHNNYYIYDKSIYIDTKTKVLIICPTHGKFLQKPGNHISGQGCPNCINRVSGIETMWLDIIGIEKKYRQICLPGLPKNMFVDGYEPKFNVVHQMHGDYWHGHPNMLHSNKFNEFHPVKKHKDGTRMTWGELYKDSCRKNNVIKKAGYNLNIIYESDFLEELNKLNKLKIRKLK